MNKLIVEVGPAWTFRVIGLITLGTAMPAAFLLKERTDIQSKKFIDWYASIPMQFVSREYSMVTRILQAVGQGLSIHYHIPCRGHRDFPALRTTVFPAALQQLAGTVFEHRRRAGCWFQLCQCSWTCGVRIPGRHDWAAQHAVCVVCPHRHQHACRVARL